CESGRKQKTSSLGAGCASRQCTAPSSSIPDYTRQRKRCSPTFRIRSRLATCARGFNESLLYPTYCLLTEGSLLYSLYENTVGCPDLCPCLRGIHPHTSPE